MFSVKRLLLPVLALASISAASVALAAEPPLAASEQSVHVEKLRTEDARLAKTVTVGESQVYLGDLLKQISEQSGVTLTVSEKNRAADTQVTVFARNMPVGDVMDRLWSLLSYQGALWYWEKQDGEARAKPTYQLVRSLAARDFPARMEARLQAKLERDMEEALDALSLPKDQLAARGKNNKAIENMAKDPRCYGEMAALNAALSRDQIRSLMRGEKEFTLPLADMPQAVKDYVAGERKLNTTTFGGTQGGFDQNGVFQLPVLGTPEPEATMIRLKRQDSPQNYSIPTVFFQYGYKSPRVRLAQPIKGDGFSINSAGGGTHFQGGAVSGGIPQEKSWNASQEDFWMLPADKKTTDETAKALPTRKDGLPELSIDESLKQFSERTGIPVFARVLSGTVKATPAPATVATYVKQLRDGELYGLYSCKWRGSTLMVADVRWWRQELAMGNKYPPGLLRDLEAALMNDPQHFHPFSSLCLAAEQIEKGVPLVLPGANSKPWLPIFASLAQKPDLLTEIQSESGVACKRLPETAYRTLYALVREKTQATPNLGTKQLRIRVENQETPKTMRRILHIELLNNGTVESVADIVTGERDVTDS